MQFFEERFFISRGDTRDLHLREKIFNEPAPRRLPFRIWKKKKKWSIGLWFYVFIKICNLSQFIVAEFFFSLFIIYWEFLAWIFSDKFFVKMEKRRFFGFNFFFLLDWRRKMENSREMSKSSSNETEEEDEEVLRKTMTLKSGTTHFYQEKFGNFSRGKQVLSF